jgi:hypothetical protein
LDEVAVAGVRLGNAILLSSSQKVIEDSGGCPLLDGLAFLLGLGHNLMVLVDDFCTVWPEGDLFPIVVDAPGFAGFPVPRLCATSDDEVSLF